MPTQSYNYCLMKIQPIVNHLSLKSYQDIQERKLSHIYHRIMKTLGQKVITFYLKDKSNQSNDASQGASRPFTRSQARELQVLKDES